jgi:putative DNA primase/helicase
MKSPNIEDYDVEVIVDKAVAKQQAKTTNGAAPDEQAPAFSEEAIALQFADRHCEGLRYVAKWGMWLVWDGLRWRRDEVRQVFSMARTLCREVSLTASKGTRKAIASAKTRAAIVALAAEDPRIAATVEQWDADPWLLNTPDGVVDLRTGELREHRPADYITKVTAASPKAKAPRWRWRQFLKEVTAGDRGLEEYLQRVIGYCLTGVTHEQELYFFYGSGRNGKGVLVQTFARILNDYHRATPIETFTVSTSERHPTDLAGLMGARMVTSAETEEGRRWSEAKIKELTGGDKISARFMRQDFFDFYPTFKLVFSGNHMPTLRTVNKAISARFRRIPFTVTIADDKIDRHLDKKLQKEWPGILAWAIEGCLAWQREDGLKPPAAVLEATEKYLETQDVLGEWLAECCILDPNAWEATGILFENWQRWAEERQEWVGSVKTFSARLEDRGGFTRCKNKEQTARGFAGLKLRLSDFKVKADAPNAGPAITVKPKEDKPAKDPKAGPSKKVRF